MHNQAKSLLNTLSPFLERNITIDDKSVCHICLEKLMGGAVRVVLMPCGHLFHEKSCIKRWQEQNQTCPVCRRSMPSD